MIRRRDFLNLTASGFAGAALSPRWLAAAIEDARPDRRLVVIQLRGGNDGLNTVIPIEDDAYHRARPRIAVAPADALPLDTHNRFHPALTHLAGHFAEGRVTVVQGVGYADSNLSHFRSQDVWDTASTAETLPGVGWLGRLNDARDATGSAIDMLAMGRDTLPLAMRATHSVGCAVPSLDSYRIPLAPTAAGRGEADARSSAMAALAARPATRGSAAVVAATHAARTSVAALANATSRVGEPEYPDTDLGRDLRAIGRIIAGGLPTRSFYVTQDGYDTHTRQTTDHPRLLADLDAALHAFLTDLAGQQALADTLIMTISEFGRRVAENGIGSSAGSDHGAGSMLLLLGGRVAAGVLGQQPDLHDLDATGNLQPKVDFRRVYAGVIQGFLGVDPTAVLPASFAPLEVVRA